MTEAQPPSAAPMGQLDIGGLVKKAWALLSADFALFIVSYLIAAVLASIPLVGIIIGGPLWFGFLRIIQKRYKGEPAQIGDVFQGFQDFSKGLITILLLVALAIVAVIPVVIVVLILAFIPLLGPVLAFILYLVFLLAVVTCTYFVLSIAALSNVQPFDAIKQSITFGLKNFGQMILLGLVTGIVGMIGVVACGVGVLLTMPLAMTMVVIAYNEYYLPKAGQAA